MAEEQETNQAEERERPALRLKRDLPGKACPGCGGKMAEDAVVCVHCGWNFLAGRKTAGEEASMRRNRTMKAAAKWTLAAIAIGAAATGAFWARGHREEAERWIDEGKERAQALVDGVEKGIHAEEAEREALLAAERERLDRELPMWKEGDKVTLEKTNGSVLTGVLSQADGGTVAVETAEGARTAGMASLSGRSRARVDAEFREEVIRRRADGVLRKNVGK